jgi:ubiquinone/menaquinone biosynthesis C-methylase UbiE
MENKKFNPEFRAKLNNPARLEKLDPEKIWEFINVKNPEMILDIGAGTAFITAALARYAPKSNIEAYDIEPVMVEEMQKNLPDYSNITPCLMEENNVPVSNNYADIVWMINLFHELHKPHALLCEIKRVLKPGGKLLIIDWAKSPGACKSGPPFDHRVGEATITSQMIGADFSNIVTTKNLPHHLGVIGTKKKSFRKNEAL